MTVANKVTKKRVMLLVKEINRSKEDLLQYLASLGIDKVTVNTTLDAETVSKVYNHFKRDLEEQEKHKKKVLDFSLRNNIDMSEAEEQKRKQEEAKKAKEEEERIKKVLEETMKREEEKKRKQELLAMLERDRMLKEQEKLEKEAKEKLEKILDEKKEKKLQKQRELEEENQKKLEEEKLKKLEEEKQKEIAAKKSDEKETVQKSLFENIEVSTAEIIKKEPLEKPEDKNVEIKPEVSAPKEIKPISTEIPKKDFPKDQSGAHSKEEAITSKVLESPFNKPIAPFERTSQNKPAGTKSDTGNEKDFKKSFKREHTDRPVNKNGKRFSEKTADGKPRESGKPGEHKPYENKRREHKPGEHRTGEHKPGEHRTGEHKPGEHRAGEHKPGEHRAGDKRPTTFDKKFKDRPAKGTKPKYEQYTLSDAKKDRGAKKPSGVFHLIL